MVKKVPYEYGDMEERDLIAFTNPNSLAKEPGVGYDINVINRIGVKKEIVDEEKEHFRNLIGAGLTNVDSFVNYCINNEANSLVVSSLGNYLCIYINNLFRFVYGSKANIDSAFTDYAELSNSNDEMVKSVFNIYSNFLRELIEVNQDNVDCIKIDDKCKEGNLLYIAYKVKVRFTCIRWDVRNILLDTKKVVTDKYGMWYNIFSRNENFETLRNELDTLFHNRMLKVFAPSKHSLNFDPISFYLYQNVKDNCYTVKLI